MSSTENLLPYHSPEMKLPRLHITVSFVKFGCMVLSLPFFSFIFCVVWSILYNFEQANSTHCSVENYFPSISAAIGSFAPQKYVWMTAITFDFPMRVSIVRVYSKYFTSVIDRRYSKLYRLAVFMNFSENCFLLGLSLISSTTHYTFHAFFFVSFLISSMCYMGLSCHMLKSRRKLPPTNIEARTLKWKFLFFIINVVCLLLAAYFFYRHNAYCEPGVYSMFALFEYNVVLSNMCFHALAIYDFYDKTVIISPGSILYS